MFVNSWFAMSSNPRTAIRKIVETNPMVGFWTMSSMYGIASCFFFAYLYSFGLFYSFIPILLSSLVLGPFVGSILLAIDASLLRITGSFFGGSAPFSYCRAATAWSKVPYCITLCMWFIFMGQDPDTVFIHVASDAPAICIALVSAAVNIWSFVLLAQALREIQSFSSSRAFYNAALARFLSFSVICLFLFVSRFAVLSII